MNRTTQKIIILAAGLMLVAGLVYWYVVLRQTETIDSFEECAAKYPVMASYPERCHVPGGKTFTKKY